MQLALRHLSSLGSYAAIEDLMGIGNVVVDRKNSFIVFRKQS